MRLISWHRWIGLLLGLFLALQGIGGALLLFREPLSRLLHPDAFVGTVVAVPALDAATMAVRVAAPDCVATRIDLPVAAAEPFRFTLTCGGALWLATAAGEDGRVLRLAPLAQWPMEWLFQFHYQLAAGEDGQQAVGWLGVALALISLLGLWLLIRQGRRDGWRRLMLPGRRGGPLRIWSGLHRAVGLYLSPLLLLLAVTGLGMAWYDTATVLLPVTPRPVPTVVVRPGQPLLPLSTILTQIDGMGLQKIASNLRFPGLHGRVVMVMLGRADGPDYDQLWFDGYDGHLIASRWAGARGGADRMMDLLYPLHTGRLLGAAGLALLLLAGLSLPLFFVSGLWLWQRRRAPATIPMRVTGLLPDGTGVLHITLRHRFGLPLPHFGAGDHVDVHLPNGLVRQYSLLGRPGRRFAWQIAVRLSDVSAGGSAWIHAHLTSGARLSLGLPRAHFPLDDGVAPVLLLAGGIGITPLLSMAWRLWEQGRPFTLLVCARDRPARPLATILAATPLAGFCHWHDSATDGRIDLSALLLAQAPGTQLYTCGPDAFMRAALDAGRALGWTPDRLHWEAFAPAAPTGPAFTAILDGALITVAAGESLLDCLLAAGIAVPHSCRRGLCGQCVVTVRAGDVDHRDSILSPADHAAGRMTACCSRAAHEGACLKLSLT
jgi:vanillate O-demethylase ferredoxin subunit